MKRKTALLASLICPLLLFSSTLFAFSGGGMDTCTVNDDCFDAIIIDGLVANHDFVCIAGCNMYASPDPLIESCQMGDFPTVWYRLSPDIDFNVLNIEVISGDIESPVISVFRSSGGCTNLEQVFLGGGTMPCIIGAEGSAVAIGTEINHEFVYYIAISSLISIGGNFDLCLSAQTEGFICVVERNIEVTARSNAGPLEGPFDPDETVSICMTVNHYTAAGNLCQWFQGLVPVFGNGWDPSSFDSNGQPLNATINGNNMGVENGLYGATIWDWFDDVGYHHDHPSYTISDLDGNGRLDMCSSVYEIDCPLQGITGGCCEPCWVEDSGTILPAGWFAYGIDGSCAQPGPPIALDWGDGNSCGAGMGPWQFCFDLKTRDVPDCLMDSTRQDLSLGFFTFADGEIGAWVGDSSVCALDAPLKLSLKAKCGRVTTHDTEYLPDLQSGDTLQYHIEEPEVSHWEWNISPFWAVPYLTNHGSNGFTIEAPLVNHTGQPVEITGILIGYISGSEDKVIRKFSFTMDETILSNENVEPHSGSNQNPNALRVFPMPANESIMVEWSFDLQQDAEIEVYNSHGVRQDIIRVSSAEANQKRMDISHWSQGVYFISLGNHDFRYVTKVVKY